MCALNQVFPSMGLIFKEVFNEEFIMNQTGKTLQVYLMKESDSFMRMLSPSSQRKRKVTMKKGKARRNVLAG